MATNTYVALNKTTLLSAASSVTFNSISQGYTDLIIVMSPATTHTSATFPYVRFNGDSGSNYSYTEVNGSAASATSFRDTNQTIGWTSPQMGSISNTLGENITIVNVMNYSNSTTNKTYFSRANRADGALDYKGVESMVGLWRNTSAITSITIGNRRGGVDYNFSIGSTFELYGILAEGVSPTTKATGGAVYSDSTYYYHLFGASGTFTPTQSITADILVVAGGGGGGGYTFVSSGGSGGGGGGAGGLLGFTSQSLTATNYTVTVGAGGAGGNGVSGTTGADSQFGALTLVKGGGFGGGNASNGTAVAGGTGGSGGGSVAWNVGSTSSGGAATSGQGNAGGGISVSGGQRGGGGGGGAGAAGTGANLSNNLGGQGGNGVASYSSWGLATGTGQNVSGTVYYAGGGAGNAGGTSPVAGGLGGGGTHVYNALPAESGIPTSGGGGAGGLYDPSLTSVGGAGGSGVVIIRYAK